MLLLRTYRILVCVGVCMNGAEECVSLDACVCVSACAVCASERCCKPNSFSSMQREEEVTERQSERVGGKVTHPCAHWRREGERCVWVGVCRDGSLFFCV